MNILFSFAVMFVLILIPLLGVKVLGLNYLFAIVLPYVAFLIFLAGMIYRIIAWARSPQPFKIPTTCGQQKSLSWIKYNRLEAPFTKCDVYLRMFFEVFLFRSLFRNLRADLVGRRLIYGSAKWLWLGAMLFHLSFLVVMLRHLRFFVQPVPTFVEMIAKIDSFFQLGIPPLYLTNILILIGLGFLLLRRFVDAKINYLSHASDYFPLLLILAIAFTGILMRTTIKVDVMSVKELAYGLATFSPAIPSHKIGAIFYVHLFLVCVLAIYFPFSKLVHMVGVFFSPTRNLPNNNRAERHINPWDYPVKYTTYCEWQEKFREHLEEAGIPVDDEWCKEQAQGKQA